MCLCQDGIHGWNYFAFMWNVPLSWSCFRSFGSDTIVCGKWCFDLHVKRCGSWMVSTIGVGASKFLGCEGFLPKFSRTCPKSFGWLCLQIFSIKDHEDLFWDDLQKGLRVLLQTLGAILWNQTRLGAILPGFSDFAQIFNKLLNQKTVGGLHLHPASYTTG